MNPKVGSTNNGNTKPSIKLRIKSCSPTWNKDFAIYTDEQFTAYQKIVGQREKQLFTDVVNQLGGPNGVEFQQIINNRTSRGDFIRRLNNRFTAIRKQAKAEVFGK